MNTLGERIKWARITAGLSQTQLGQKLGYGDKSKSRISNWETNTSSPSVEELAKLCYILQANPNILLPVEVRALKVEAQDIARNAKICKLNAEGQGKVDAFIDDLLATKKYDASIDPATGKKIRRGKADTSPTDHPPSEQFFTDLPEKEEQLKVQGMA